MTTWQLFSLAVLLLLSPSVSVVALWMMYQSQTRLLRMISERSGIPAITMESVEPRKEVVKLADTRKRISIPIPGAANFRKPA